MRQTDSPSVKLPKYPFGIKESDSFLVKLRKLYFPSLVAGTVGGFAGGFIHALQYSRSPESVINTAIIGGLSYSSAEVVSLLGKTLWQKILLWVTTMIVIVNLIHLLVPSLDFWFHVGFAPSSLIYYLVQKLYTYKKR